MMVSKYGIDKVIGLVPYIDDRRFNHLDRTRIRRISADQKQTRFDPLDPHHPRSILYPAKMK
jgi:hypothetical protein